MEKDVREEITRYLAETGGYEPSELDELVPEVYAELRELAARHMRSERAEHTLSPTALAHEAYLRLAGHREPRWRDRSHVLAVASCVIRRLLVDHARSRRVRRPAGVDEAAGLVLTHEERTFDLLALDEALDQLRGMDPRQGRLVELRFFGGLTIAESAEVLDVSPATVKRDWELARAWLFRALFGD